MKAYKVLVDNSDYPFLVLANSIGEVETKMGEYKNNIFEIQLLDYSSNHIVT